MLGAITPVILTYNEAPNIARSLEKLRWAHRVVVVDSGSTDGTPAIAAAFPNVSVFSHSLVSLAEQWNYATRETGIETAWLLRLDADYVLDDDFVTELAALQPPAGVNAYRVRFIYCIHGKPLRGSLYPADYKLFRRNTVSFVQDGHTERPVFAGEGPTLKSLIKHDDRKPLGRWLWSQDLYMAAEAKKLSESPFSQLDWVDRLRKHWLVGPPVVFLFCLFGKGLILDGRAGLHYALQRTVTELILALHLLDVELRREE